MSVLPPLRRQIPQGLIGWESQRASGELVAPMMKDQQASRCRLVVDRLGIASLLEFDKQRN